MSSLGNVSKESFFFPVFRRGKAVFYDSARTQLNKEKVVLELGKVTLHRSGYGGC